MVHSTRCLQLGLPRPPPMSVRRNKGHPARDEAGAGNARFNGAAGDSCRSRKSDVSLLMRAQAVSRAAVGIGRRSVVAAPRELPTQVYMSPHYARLPPTGALVSACANPDDRLSRDEKMSQWAAGRGTATSVRQEMERAMEGVGGLESRLAVGGAGAQLTADLSLADAVVVLLYAPRHLPKGALPAKG